MIYEGTGLHIFNIQKKIYNYYYKNKLNTF